MSSIYDEYSHLKCPEFGCDGNVMLPRGIFPYRCDKCGKEVSYHYVRVHADAQFINDETGIIFQMVKKKKDSGDGKEKE